MGFPALEVLVQKITIVILENPVFSWIDLLKMASEEVNGVGLEPSQERLGRIQGTRRPDCEPEPEPGPDQTTNQSI